MLFNSNNVLRYYLLLPARYFFFSLNSPAQRRHNIFKSHGFNLALYCFEVNISHIYLCGGHFFCLY